MVCLKGEEPEHDKVTFEVQTQSNWREVLVPNSTEILKGYLGRRQILVQYHLFSQDEMQLQLPMVVGKKATEVEKEEKKEEVETIKLRWD